LPFPEPEVKLLQRFKQRDKHMPIKIVCMGDSNVVGQFVSPSLRWTSRLENALAEKHGQDRIELLNQGLNGETTRGGLERFPVAVQAEEPTIVTLQYGMNDCNCWNSDRGVHRVSLKAFKENLTEMIDRCRLFGAREVILCTNHRSFRRGRMVSGESYESANARYSDAIRDVALVTEVTLCDFRAAFSEFADNQLEPLLLPAPDALHLSEAGHVIYADLLLPHLDAAIAAAAVLEVS
jgi:lysophospholipase L1-like esterase